MMNKNIHILAGVFLVLVLVVLVLLSRGKTLEKRVVLLSFDVEPVDGENPIDIAEVLNANGVKATFFVTGEYAEQHPQIVKSLAQDHEIGCHSYSHKKLTKLNDDDKREEIVKCKKIVESVIGSKITGFRAPWHKIDLSGLMILEEEGFEYDASAIRGWGAFYPSVSGLGEVRVSSFFMIPLEDVIWMYYMKVPGVFYKIIENKRTPLESYVFHPHHAVKDLDRFESFIKTLKSQNVTFISHSQLVEKT